METDLEEAVRENLIRYGGDTFPEIVVEARGSYVTTIGGRKILDFTSGQMCSTIGHNHPAIVRAIQRSADRAVHLFSGMIPDSVARLARKMASLMPPPLTRSLFVNTGSESNEAALKMAKLATGGFEVVALGGSWHGITGGAGVGFLRQRPQGAGAIHARHLRHSRAERLSLPGRALPRQMRPDLHEGRLAPVRHAVERRAGGDHRRARHQRRAA